MWRNFDASKWGGRYSEHVQLLVGRFLEQIGEQRRRQVALTERRNHHRDNLTRIHLLTKIIGWWSVSLTFPLFSGLLDSSTAAFTAAPEEIPQKTP